MNLPEISERRVEYTESIIFNSSTRQYGVGIINISTYEYLGWTYFIINEW